MKESKEWRGGGLTMPRTIYWQYIFNMTLHAQPLWPRFADLIITERAYYHNCDICLLCFFWRPCLSRIGGGKEEEEEEMERGM